jgi:hypothetical protein
MHGTSLSSATLAVGLQSIEPLEAVMMSTLSLRMSSLATSAVSFVGLAVLGDDLDLVGLSADLQPGRQDLADSGERPILRFGKARHRAGLRADMADLDDQIVRAQHGRGKHRAGRNRRRASFQQAAAGRVDQNRPATITPYQLLVFHFISSPGTI